MKLRVLFLTFMTMMFAAYGSIGIRNFDYIEWYVGSAKMTAFWHAKAMGFDIVGYSGPEAGVRDRVSYYLKKNDIKVVITSPLQPSTSDVICFTNLHGDGIKRFSYEVDDVKECYEYATSHGGVSVRKPHLLEDEYGVIEQAAIKVYDDTEIVLVNYDRYQGVFKPGFVEFDHHMNLACEESNLETIDHVVGNVRANEMRKWANYLNSAFDFETYIDFGPGDINTQYSALLSTVVRSKDSAIKNPINEPFIGLRKSQIQEYIEEYHGSGVQHIAITTEDICKTIQALKDNGLEFLRIPDAYYDELRARNLPIKENIDDLQRLGILCDFEGEGYLLQIFTKPVSDRPTFFYEIIQRQRGASGFGKGNFRALFESIEIEQEKRGNLTLSEEDEFEQTRQVISKHQH